MLLEDNTFDASNSGLRSGHVSRYICSTVLLLVVRTGCADHAQMLLPAACNQQVAGCRTRRNKKQKSYDRNKQLFAVWKEVTEALKRSFEGGSNWKTRAEANIFALKKNIHGVLNVAAVQNFWSTCSALRARVPYSYEVLPGPEQAADGDDAENGQYAAVVDLFLHVKCSFE